MKSHRSKEISNLLLMIYSSASIVANRCYLQLLSRNLKVHRVVYET